MDIILPAAMNYERHAPFGWYGPNIAVRKPIKPLGEAKEDWRIALELGCIIDKPEHFFDGDPEKALDFILHQYEGGDLVKFRDALPQISQNPASRSTKTEDCVRTENPASTRFPASWTSSLIVRLNSATPASRNTNR